MDLGEKAFDIEIIDGVLSLSFYVKPVYIANLFIKSKLDYSLNNKFVIILFNLILHVLQILL